MTVLINFYTYKTNNNIFSILYENSIIAKNYILLFKFELTKTKKLSFYYYIFQLSNMFTNQE